MSIMRTNSFPVVKGMYSDAFLFGLTFTICLKQKRKYRGMFEIQKSGDKISSGEIGLDIRAHASPKVGQDPVSGGVSVPCWHTRCRCPMETYIQ